MKSTLSEIRMFCYSMRLAIPLALLAFTSAAIAATFAVTVDLTADPETAFTASPGDQITLRAAVVAAAPTSLPVTGTGFFFTFNGSMTVPLTCAGGTNPATLVNGQATCLASFTQEGDHQIYVNYGGDANFAQGSATTFVYVMNHATNTGNLYCNSGTINADGHSDVAYFHTSPYPSVIFVGDGVNTDIPGTVSNVSVTLKGFSAANLNNVRILLMAPDSTHTLDIVDGVTGSAGRGDYTLSDGQADLIFGAANVPGSYAPFAGNVGPFTDAPAPAPQLPTAFSIPYPAGNAAFYSAFAGATGHGPWSLFLYDASGQPATAAGGWCINFTPATGTPTTTTVSANPTRATKGSPVNFLATIFSASDVSGKVTFTENNAPLTGAPNNGVATVFSSPGAAIISTSGLPEGDHTIVATYHDPSGVNADSQATITIRVDAATSTPTYDATTGEWTYCNPSVITIPAGAFTINDIGSASPNPSNTFVSNLPGTINSVSLTLKGFHYLSPVGLESLLVGPNGLSAPGTAQTLDFFSQVGLVAPAAQDTTFSDLGPRTPCTVTGTLGTLLAPVSCGPTTSYVRSPSYVLPSNLQRAQPAGGFTFNTGTYTPTEGGVFSNTNGNGTWSLYFNKTTHGTGSGVNNGWCMNLTENPVAVSVTPGHTGPAPNDDFVQGQQGAFTFSILNNGPGPTGDPDGNHPLTLIDTLHPGLTFRSFSGTDWLCIVNSNVVTCTNHDAIQQGDSYPGLTIYVNVSGAATPGNVTVPFVVSGGGTSGTSGTVSVTIDPAPVLTILKTHTGTFPLGGTGQWNITVSDSVAGSNSLGSTTVTDTLPSGYIVNSVTGTGWTCIGAGTGTASCTSTQAVAGGSAFPTIQLMANVPTNSPASVSNTAGAYGGGDEMHFSPSTAASSTDTVSVEQGGVITFTQTKLDVVTGTAGSFDFTSSFNIPAPFLINPVTQLVTFGIGPYVFLIPVGSLHPLLKGNKAGSFVYNGTINGVNFDAQINPLGGQFQFKVAASPLNTTVLSSPVTGWLTIGIFSGLYTGTF